MNVIIKKMPGTTKIPRRYAKRKLHPRSDGARKRFRYTYPPASIRQGNKVGFSVGIGNSKRFKNNQALDIPTRRLFAQELTNIPQTTTNAINNRQRQIIHVSGFDVNFSMFNNRGQPLYMNVALVAPTTGTLLTSDNFFRGYEGNRSTAFSTLLAGIELHTRPINADRYNVLMHQRILLSPERNNVVSSQAYGGGQQSYHTIVKKWVPYNTQLRFDDATANTALNGTVYLCYWCDDINTVSGDPEVLDTAIVRSQVITYFKETAD